VNCEAGGFETPDNERQELKPRDIQTVENTEISSSKERHEAILEIREIPGTEDFYNAAAWKENGITYLLGRKVPTAGGEGEPDIGSLRLIKLGSDGNIESFKDVWQPKEGEYLLEDARALPLPDGEIAFGLTSVAKEDNKYVPYPAVLITSTEELMNGDLPEPTTIKTMGKGSETTPLSDSEINLAGKNVTALGPNLFAFRPEGRDHQLRVFQYQKSNEATHQQYIDIPKNIAWAEYRAGTTIPPIWLNRNEAFFLIHGINIINGKYVYSIGSSRLFKEDNGILSVDNISTESLIHPDSFVDKSDSNEVELHRERRVVYCCGGTPEYSDTGELRSLKLYINVGDKRTAEVTVSVDKLIRKWQRSESFEQEALTAA
jgi:hypothetical protein